MWRNREKKFNSAYYWLTIPNQVAIDNVDERIFGIKRTIANTSISVPTLLSLRRLKRYAQKQKHLSATFQRSALFVASGVARLPHDVFLALLRTGIFDACTKQFASLAPGNASKITDDRIALYVEGSSLGYLIGPQNNPNMAAMFDMGHGEDFAATYIRRHVDPALLANETFMLQLRLWSDSSRVHVLSTMEYGRLIDQV